MSRTARTASVGIAVALAFGITACGSSGADVAADKKQTLTVWAMGAEGEKLADVAKVYEKSHPNITVKVTPVGWDVAHQKLVSAAAGRHHAGRGADGRQLHGRVLRARCPGAGGHQDLRQEGLLPVRLEPGRGGRHRVRRAVVRRHPRPLLPHRPGREGRHRQGSDQLEGDAGPRHRVPEEGRYQVGPVHPAQRPGHGAELLLLPVLGRMARSSTTRAKPSSTAPRPSRRSRSTARTSTRACPTSPWRPATTW